MEFLPLVAIALVFWLMIVRPASKRQKEIGRLQSSIKPGDRVLLSSGIFATVRETTEDRIHAEIADGVVVELARGAVAAIEPSPVVETPIEESIEESGIDSLDSGTQGRDDELGPETPGPARS